MTNDSTDSADDSTGEAPVDRSPSGERADLLEALATHRDLLRVTVTGIDDEQARRRSTVSELTLGGIVKHVTAMQRQWIDFVEHGPGEPVDWAAIDWSDPPPEVVAHMASFSMGDDENLDGLLADFDAASRSADRVFSTVDLDASHPLPEAPWFEPGATRSNRRVAVHLVAEIAQHAGHADIIREAIDGQKTMG